jgi:hypothetical protein
VDLRADQIEGLKRVVEVAGCGPHPVYAVDWLCDVLAWNEAATSWYTDFGALHEDQRNMLWWMLNDPVARERIVDWERETRDLIARFRAVSAWRKGHSRLNRLMRELRATSPEFVKWWDAHEVGGQQMRLRVLHHPEFGTRTFHLAVLYPSDQDACMVVLHPPRQAPA